MPTETVYFGQDEHQIKTAPVTLVFNSSHSDSYYPDRVMLTPTITLAHFKTLESIDPYTAALFKMVVPDYDQPMTVEILKHAPEAFQHLIGLMHLSLLFFSRKEAFGWKYPEAQLHPKYQGNLADVLILFSNSTAFIKFVKEIRDA